MVSVEDRVIAIEAALTAIDLQGVTSVFPKDESYKLKEKLIYLEVEAKAEFKALKEQNKVTVEALKEISLQAEKRDKELQEHNASLQAEIKAMQDAGNKYAKDLAEAEELKWKQQYESLNTQFKAISEEFIMHKTELQARAVKLDQVEANLNSLAGSTGMTLQQAINHLAELKESSAERKKSITELKCISNLEKISNNKLDYNLWLERLKAALDQYDLRARSVLEALEKDTSANMSYDEWVTGENQLKIFRGIEIEPSIISAMRRPIYSVLINKVDGEMAIKIRSNCQDGLFSFSLLHRWFMETSGDGLAEKRVYVMNPQQAKQESEIYHLVDKWERELLDLQKVAGNTEIMSESLMKSALKKICCGKMKEHVDVYENIDGYNKLRNHVMDYALKKLRDTGKTTTNTGMDLSVVMKELEDRLRSTQEGGYEVQDYGHYHPGGKGCANHDHGHEAEEENPNVKFADTLMAMFKGKGKGKGKGSVCWNCGQQGHIARNCPNKGNGKGYGKSQFKGNCHYLESLATELQNAGLTRTRGKVKEKGIRKGLMRYNGQVGLGRVLKKTRLCSQEAKVRRLT